jgi:hypothetical protein
MAAAFEKIPVAGLIPAIHVLRRRVGTKTWVAGTSPATGRRVNYVPAWVMPNSQGRVSRASRS